MGVMAPGLRYLESVATLRLDAEACNGCGMCRMVCPHAVFARVQVNVRPEAAPAFSRKRKVRKRVEIVALDSCMECGACAMNCPTGALTVHPGVGCAWAILKEWITGARAKCEPRAG